MNRIKLFSFVLLAVVLLSFQLPNSIQKKVDREVKMAFEIETFSLNVIEVSDDLNSQLPAKISDKNLYSIHINTKKIGYAFIDKAASKADQFDYLILFDKNLIIKKAKVLVYREDYGGEIGSKRWLKQFIGKTIHDKLSYQKDIMAISGATISASSMTKAVNNVLQTVGILHKKKIL